MPDFLTTLFGSRALKIALPFIILIVGLAGFAYGIFGTFESETWKFFWLGIGKICLTGALFAVLLKTMQFSGVFKEELTKIIFEPKFLGNRKDLPQYWEKVSQELLKNKFPAISSKLLSDVQEMYLPTKQYLYYDDNEHVIEIQFEDYENSIISVKKTITLTAIPTNKNGSYEYEFGSTMPYKNSPEAEISFSSIIKLNGTKVDDLNIKKDKVNNNLFTKGSIQLCGLEKYVIERIDEKKYDIDFDNIMYFRSKRIHNKLKVEIHYPKDKLKIELKKCGTLEEFVSKQQTVASDRYICRGIIYPEQGYYINLRKI